MYTLKGGRLGGMTVGVGVVGLMLAMIGTSAMAQKMYRCGSVYQDHPCSGEQPGKVIGSYSAPNPEADTAKAADPACAARGVRSQKISWAREAGRTQEEQLNASPRDSDLILEVYGMRGSAPTIRAAVVANCVALRERENQAAMLEDAAAQLRGGRRSGVVDRGAAMQGDQAVDSSRTATGGAASIGGSSRSRANSSGQGKSENCRVYSEEKEEIQRWQRIGGSIGTMESLNEQMRGLEKRKSAAGC